MPPLGYAAAMVIVYDIVFKKDVLSRIDPKKH